jgi:two-component system, OmpR family, sensor histidine kinase KdpD
VTRLRRRGQFVVRTLKGLAALIAVLVTTALFETLVPVADSTAGFVYLLEVLVTAAFGGFFESLAASVVAGGCFNYYFLPPLRTFVIAGPHNWVAFFAFLATALIGSELSAAAKKKAAEATSRRLEMERLYEMSRAIMQIKPNPSIAAQVVEEVLRVYPVRGVALLDSGHRVVYSAGECGVVEFELRLKVAARDCASLDEPEHDIVLRPLMSGGKCVGSFLIRGNTSPEAAIQALLNLIAITMENARSHLIATSAEAVRQSEEFKSTLLDALAHEFKTPLTSIKGATTALLSGGNLKPAQRDELLTVVDQEAERLNRLVTETTQLARIEAGKVQLNRRTHTVSGLIGSALDQMSLGRDGRLVDLSIATGLPPVQIDLQLMQVALKQLLDNAVKYSARKSPVGISAKLVDDAVEIGVHNWGEPLPPEEQARIFDKFYRGRNVGQHILGTGMGLAIAKEILVAHGGTVKVESSAERGTLFSLRFPISVEAGRA